MAEATLKTCAYCAHHIWSDHQFFHICIKDGTRKECVDTCDGHKGNSIYNYLLKVEGRK